jgi:hypothetical protein
MTPGEQRGGMGKRDRKRDREWKFGDQGWGALRDCDCYGSGALRFGICDGWLAQEWKGASINVARRHKIARTVNKHMDNL